MKKLFFIFSLFFLSLSIQAATIDDRINKIENQINQLTPLLEKQTTMLSTIASSVTQKMGAEKSAINIPEKQSMNLMVNTTGSPEERVASLEKQTNKLIHMLKKQSEEVNKVATYVMEAQAKKDQYFKSKQTEQDEE